MPSPKKTVLQSFRKSVIQSLPSSFLFLYEGLVKNGFRYFFQKSFHMIFITFFEALHSLWKYYGPNIVNNYMLKVNNENTRKRCETCSKLTIKTLELFLYPLKTSENQGLYSAGIESVLVSLLSTFDIFHTFFLCADRWR